MPVYELICEFIHCKGPVQVVMGTAGSEEKARKWVAAQKTCDAGLFKKFDPNCDCPVAFCAMRGQSPRFSYRESRH